MVCAVLLVLLLTYLYTLFSYECIDIRFPDWTLFSVSLSLIILPRNIIFKISYL